MAARDKWQAIRRGPIYCAPRCGGGCTWEAYQRAQRDGAWLAKRLGDGWVVEVWENLGWHVAVNKGVCSVHPIRDMLGRAAWIYTVFFNTEKQVVISGADPCKAVVLATKRVQELADKMLADLKEVA